MIKSHITAEGELLSAGARKFYSFAIAAPAMHRQIFFIIMIHNLVFSTRSFHHESLHSFTLKMVSGSLRAGRKMFSFIIHFGSESSISR